MTRSRTIALILALPNSQQVFARRRRSRLANDAFFEKLGSAVPKSVVVGCRINHHKLGAGQLNPKPAVRSG
jgi:hypothetical protein